MKFAPQIKTTALAALLAFAFAGTATAAMEKTAVKAEKDRIAEQYKSAKAACRDMKANAKDICMAEAKGAEKIAKADLEARDKGTPKSQYELRKTKADADYKVAKEKCDDLKGNPKDVCVKDAKAAHTTAKANAKADMKTSKAWGARVLPATFIVDPQGKVRYSYYGAIDWSRADVRDAISRLIAK